MRKTEDFETLFYERVSGFTLLSNPKTQHDRVLIKCHRCGRELSRFYYQVIAKGEDFHCKECKKDETKARQRAQKEVKIAERQSDSEQHIRELVTERCPTFEYVGNYSGSDGFALIKCKICGHSLMRSCVSIRHGTAKCDNCESMRIEAAKRAAAEDRQKREQALSEAREAKWWQGKQEQIGFAICPKCGKSFIPSRYQKKYCSRECSVAANNAISKDRRLKRMKGAASAGITLERLYERDKGICHICGGLCQWDDFTQTDKAFIAGESYPSVDHIVPLSKGGKHSWDNVGLAHRRCNSLKGDALHISLDLRLSSRPMAEVRNRYST